MKLRHKEKDWLAESNRFNTHGLSEIIVYYKEGDTDSDFIVDYDVFITKTENWKDLREAFKDKDLITDNNNQYFFEPKNDKDRERGYTLY